MSSIWQNRKVFICFIFSVIISRGSASDFIEMIMLFSFESTLTQTRMGFGRITLSSTWGI